MAIATTHRTTEPVKEANEVTSDIREESPMRGRTVVITGGTSGIGEVAAVTLARIGARIVLIARDKTRTDATLARLREYTPGIAPHILPISYAWPK
jgi:short-subunit dehydrogenase